jgi:hypothetical protein
MFLEKLSTVKAFAGELVKFKFKVSVAPMVSRTTGSRGVL